MSMFNHWFNDYILALILNHKKIGFMLYFTSFVLH